MQHATLLVGLSNRGHAWAKTLEDHDRFFIKGISEINQQLLPETGEKYEIPPTNRFTDYQMALDSGQFEVVVLVVPSHLHCSMATLALEAGLHVLVEKPFALRMGEAEEVVQLADRVNKSLTVVQNYRYKENFLELARQIARKPLGQLLAVMGDFRSWRQPKADHELAYPNPMMTIQGVHFLDTLRAILPSPITKVHSVGHRSQLSGWEIPPSGIYSCNVKMEFPSPLPVVTIQKRPSPDIMGSGAFPVNTAISLSTRTARSHIKPKTIKSRFLRPAPMPNRENIFCSIPCITPSPPAPPHQPAAPIISRPSSSSSRSIPQLVFPQTPSPNLRSSESSADLLNDHRIIFAVLNPGKIKFDKFSVFLSRSHRVWHLFLIDLRGFAMRLEHFYSVNA